MEIYFCHWFVKSNLKMYKELGHVVHFYIFTLSITTKKLYQISNRRCFSQCFSNKYSYRL